MINETVGTLGGQVLIWQKTISSMPRNQNNNTQNRFWNPNCLMDANKQVCSLNILQTYK